jgi:hypothetical protein
MANWGKLNDINEFKIVEQVATIVELANYLISFSFRGAYEGQVPFCFYITGHKFPTGQKSKRNPECKHSLASKIILQYCK